MRYPIFVLARLRGRILSAEIVRTEKEGVSMIQNQHQLRPSHTLSHNHSYKKYNSPLMHSKVEKHNVENSSLKRILLLHPYPPHHTRTILFQIIRHISPRRQ